MAVRNIRGAITIKENTYDEIINNTELLLGRIIEENQIEIDSIISVIFTATRDIDAAYPAVAARNMGITQAGLMCTQEMYVKGSLEMCIRLQMLVESEKMQSKTKNIYMKKAKKLRPDLINISIAIDGPSGSGKSTAAKLIAKKLGYVYVDTGAMYRAVALFCINNGIDYNNKDAVIYALNDIEISFVNEKLFLNGVDSTTLVRSDEVALGASAVAKIGEVREKLVYLQQDIAKNQNVVMDGRDICTKVLPNATLKIFMDADLEQRVQRRCGELKKRNFEYDYDEVKKDLQKRDNQDSNRENSPLVRVEDAVLIDTTNMNIEQVLEKIIELLDEA